MELEFNKEQGETMGQENIFPKILDKSIFNLIKTTNP